MTKIPHSDWPTTSEVNLCHEKWTEILAIASSIYKDIESEPFVASHLVMD